MHIPPEFLDEIRSRVKVSEVIGRSLKLQKRGREYVGLSPFNQEKTPSFTVNDQKGFYHCFSSGNNGDIFKFLMETQGLKFWEAVETLATEVGLEMPRYAPNAPQNNLQPLYDLLEMATTWFENQLFKNQNSLQYLMDRGLTEATIRQFRLGYSPGQFTKLKDYLNAQGISEERMIAAGLVRKSQNNTKCYDYFRERIIFPITDKKNRVIAFGARTLNNSQPKYLNSPESPLFHKGHVLYGIAKARKAAFDKGYVLVCEGYMDVITLAQYNFTHTVAPLGTAITEHQVKELWTLAPEPILCLDGDNAGLKAAIKAAERTLEILKPGHSLQFALMPAGDDPDTYVHREGGEALENLINNRVPLADLLFNNVFNKITQTSPPEQRAAAEKQLQDLAGTINDPIVRRHYIQYFKKKSFERFQKNFSPYSKKYSRKNNLKYVHFPFRSERNRIRQNSSLEIPLKDQKNQLFKGIEAALIGMMIKYPEIIQHIAEDAALLKFDHDTLNSVLSSILGTLELNSTIVSSEELKSHLTNKGFKHIIDTLEENATSSPLSIHVLEINKGVTETLYQNSPQEVTDPLQTYVKAWRDIFTLHRRSIIEKNLKTAEHVFAENPNDKTWQQISNLRLTLTKLNSINQDI